MSIARLAALGIVVSMTALPIASCGVVDFTGHRILRNKPPDPEAVLKSVTGQSFGDVFKSAMAGAAANGQAVDPDAMKAAQAQIKPSDLDSKPLFDSKDRWLHFLYLGVFAIAVAGLVLPVVGRTRAIMGFLGGGGLVVFLWQFEKAIFREAAGQVPGLGLDWKAGAWLSLVGFGIFVVQGLRGEGVPLGGFQPRRMNGGALRGQTVLGRNLNDPHGTRAPGAPLWAQTAPALPAPPPTPHASPRTSGPIAPPEGSASFLRPTGTLGGQFGGSSSGAWARPAAGPTADGHFVPSVASARGAPRPASASGPRFQGAGDDSVFLEPSPRRPGIS